MLPVGVGCDNAGAAITFFLDISEACFECIALAAVFFVMKNMAPVKVFKLVEDGLIGWPGTVVHNHYAGKALVQKLKDIGNKLTVRFKGRDQHRYLPGLHDHIRTCFSSVFNY
jgi:hypothetical protein